MGKTYWSECRTDADYRDAGYQLLRERGVLPEHARRMAGEVAARVGDGGADRRPLTVAAGGTSAGSASTVEAPRPYLPLPHCLLED